MHNFTSWASKKISFVNFALVFERQEGQHFTDSIKSLHLVIHDLPSVCLNQVSYQSLMWDVRRINLSMFSPLGTADRLWLQGLYGIYGPRCPLSPERPLNLITHSLLQIGVALAPSAKPPRLNSSHVHVLMFSPFIWGTSKIIMTCMKVHYFFGVHLVWYYHFLDGSSKSITFVDMLDYHIFSIYWSL